MEKTNPKHEIGSTKPTTHYIPPSAEYWMGYALQTGGWEYEWFNWGKSDVVWSIYYDAARRHLDKMLAGEDRDGKSGAPHEAHVMACMAILIDARAQGKLNDDRPHNQTAKLEPIFDEIMTLIAKRMNPGPTGEGG